MTSPLEKKRHRPLRFALGLCAVCALIVAVPLVGPRLLAGAKWDEPDVRPERMLKEPGSYLRGLCWSHNGKRLRYFVESYAHRSWDDGALARVERSWPEMAEVSREVVAQGSNRALLDYAADAAVQSIGAGIKPEANRAGDLTLGVGRGRWVQRRAKTGRVASGRVGQRLRLMRAGRVLRSWPLPDHAPGESADHTPLLSPDGKLAMAVTRTSVGINPPRSLGEWLGSHNAFGGGYGGIYEIRAWRTSDGEPALFKRFSGEARGRDAGGGTWVQRLSYERPIFFDGRALWFALAPHHLPRNDAEEFAKMRALNIKDVSEAAGRSLPGNSWLSDELVLFDALSGRWRTLAPRSPRLARAWGNPARNLNVGLYWDPITLSPDLGLIAAKISGSGSTPVLEQLGSGTLFVWDLKSGRSLWQSTPGKLAQGAWISRAQFSPDGKMLAYALGRGDVIAVSTSLVVVEARTGRVIGAPLLEQSPRQRFEESRLRWQRPLQDRTRRISDALASATPTPSRQADDGFMDFHWAPDSRHLVSTYLGARLKVWRVPNTQQPQVLAGATATQNAAR